MDDEKSELNVGSEYLRSRAMLYIDAGPADFSHSNYFGLPGKYLSEKDAGILRDGCIQIFGNRGFTQDEPLENLGIIGFYKLMRIFHFHVIGQAIVAQSRECIIYAITLEHILDKSTLVLYNKITG